MKVINKCSDAPVTPPPALPALKDLKQGDVYLTTMGHKRVIVNTGGGKLQALDLDTFNVRDIEYFHSAPVKELYPNATIVLEGC